MNLTLVYLILLTVILSVFIYSIYNSGGRLYKQASSLRDIESDGADISDTSDTMEMSEMSESIFPLDILNQIPSDGERHSSAIEHFYDNIVPTPVSQGDVTYSGKQCHWKMYKKPHYYGWGKWGRQYGEPYYMKIKCDDTSNKLGIFSCSDKF